MAWRTEAWADTNEALATPSARLMLTRSGPRSGGSRRSSAVWVPWRTLLLITTICWPSSVPQWVPPTGVATCSMTGTLGTATLAGLETGAGCWRWLAAAIACAR